MGGIKSDLAGMKPLTHEEHGAVVAEIRRIEAERGRVPCVRGLCAGFNKSFFGFIARKRVVDHLSPDLANLEDREYVYTRVFGSDFCPRHPFLVYLFHSSFDSIRACFLAAMLPQRRSVGCYRSFLAWSVKTKRAVASALGANVESVFPEVCKSRNTGFSDGSTRFSRFLRAGGTTAQTLVSELGVSRHTVHNLLYAGKDGRPKFAEYTYWMRRIARCFHKTVQSLFADIVKKPSIRCRQRSKLLRVLANPENVNRLESVLPSHLIYDLRERAKKNPYYLPCAATRKRVCGALELSEASIWPPAFMASRAAFRAVRYARVARDAYTQRFAQKQKE